MFNYLVAINKDQGYTSHDVVAKLRGILGQKRIGHAGTLDPLATGVLVVGFGYATKLLEYFSVEYKTYDATFSFGKETRTDDIEGDVIYKHALSQEMRAQLTSNSFAREILAKLKQQTEQLPPAYSAVSINGKRSYERARTEDKQVVEATLTRRPIEVAQADLLCIEAGNDTDGNAGADREGKAGSEAGGNAGSDVGVNTGSDVGVNTGSDVGVNTGSDVGVNTGDDAGGNANSNTKEMAEISWKIHFAVSKGTYIRSLARDLGRELGVGAYVRALQRVSSGRIQLKDCVSLADLQKAKDSSEFDNYLREHALNPYDVLDIPFRFVSPTDLKKARVGDALLNNEAIYRGETASLRPQEKVALFDDRGVWGIWEARNQLTLRCDKNFAEPIEGLEVPYVF